MKRAMDFRWITRAGRAVVANSLLVSFLLLAAWPTLANARQVPQQAPQQAPGYNRPHDPGLGSNEPEPMSGSNAMKLEHMREGERRKRLLADTAKLLQLSTELKEQVDKSSKDELSLDVVRKATEIEKLARDVKERMKG